ncbi:hypothetical protein DER45DRAFT_570908 [Fusarium avenaceum]|nr:hypothetical protein DER45DRAFT_570908 [Fusarium avenaceum]
MSEPLPYLTFSELLLRVVHPTLASLFCQHALSLHKLKFLLQMSISLCLSMFRYLVVVQRYQLAWAHVTIAL